MKSLLSALALSLALPGAAMAQNVSSGPVVAAGNTLLSLNAEGRVARAPDLAVFTAGVTSQGQTAGAALAANAADMTKVIAALKKAGIADRDIQTSNLNLNPTYAPQRQLPDGSITPAQPTIIGYQVSNQVTVRQRNLREFGRVIDTLVSAGANQVNGPSFEIDNADSALDEARVEAVKKARARAELYARAAGLRVVRILSISEGGGYAPPPPIMYARSAMAMDAAAPVTSVSAGELSLNINVNVMFELAPQ